MNRPIPDPASPAAVLEIGERVAEAPSRCLTDIAFRSELRAQLGLSSAINWVDLAHTLTLAEQGIIPRDSARTLIAALLVLHEAPASFAPAADYGDLYTNREAWLAQSTEAAGWLGVARARREALTTAYHLILCDALLDMGAKVADAAEMLKVASLRYKNAFIPDYTYLQVAQPTTFGHYLQSFAWPMLRDLDRVRTLYDRADRLAEDLMIFASAEFAFIKLADRHARASKIMPQKRNPFALAFVRATANRLIGVQAGIAAASRTPSAQMDNRLFAYEAVPDAVRSAGEAASLVAECVEGLHIDEARARDALGDRSVCASDLAERVMAASRIDYRTARGVVGRLITALEECGLTLAQVTATDVGKALREVGASPEGVADELVAAALDLGTCISARTDVGGAAPAELTAMASALDDALNSHRQGFDTLRARREASLRRLDEEARTFAGEAE